MERTASHPAANALKKVLCTLMGAKHLEDLAIADMTSGPDADFDLAGILEAGDKLSAIILIEGQNASDNESLPDLLEQVINAESPDCPRVLRAAHPVPLPDVVTFVFGIRSRIDNPFKGCCVRTKEMTKKQILQILLM